MTEETKLIDSESSRPPDHHRNNVPYMLKTGMKRAASEASEEDDKSHKPKKYKPNTVSDGVGDEGFDEQQEEIKVLKRRVAEMEEEAAKLRAMQKKLDQQINDVHDTSSDTGYKGLKPFLSVISPQDKFGVQEAHLEGKNLWIDGKELQPGSGRFKDTWIKTLSPRIASGARRFAHCLWAFECGQDDTVAVEYKGVRFQRINVPSGPFEAFVCKKRNFTIENSRYMEFEILVEHDVPPVT